MPKTYRKRVYIGTVNGVKKYKAVYGQTKKEAQQRAASVKADLHKGLDVTRGSDTVAEWTDMYVAHKKPTLTPGTCRALDAFGRTLKSQLGDRKINAVKLVHVQSAVNDYTFSDPQHPLIKDSVENYRKFIRAVFQFAIDNDAIAKNPADKVVVPHSAPSRQRTALDPRTRAAVESFAHPMQFPALVMMYSGLRRGELLALLWSDVDLANATITVSKSREHYTGAIKAPKNGKTRTVTIPQKLVATLKAAPHRGPRVVDSAPYDPPLSPKSWDWHWYEYQRDLHTAFPDAMHFTAHQLRHTFCTLLYEAGVDVMVAQEQMGHASPAMTLGIYTTLRKEHADENLSKLDAYLDKLQ